MVSSFSPEDQVLYYRPKGHVRPGGREYLLWPTWAYRVVAPRVRDRELNMFQRAILGLCRAGVVEAESIGTKLSIHSDLAVVIMRELYSLNFLTQNGVPTKKGVQVLDDDAFESHDMVSGYVFQDPWTGDLWPRFVERFEYCDLEMGQKGFPSLLLGTTGKPYRQSAFMVFPDSGLYPSKPLPEKVVSAVASHRKALKLNNRSANWEDDAPSSFVPTNARIERVSFVEENPIPVFLTTFLYLPVDESDAQGWYIADPFGMGASSRLRRRVEQVIQEQPNLYNVVNRLVGRRLSEGLEEQKKWLEMLRQSAELEVEQQLSLDIRRHAAFDQIANMAFAHQEVDQLGEDSPEAKIHDVLRSGVKVLEKMFSELQVRYPFGDIWKRVYAERVDRQTGRRHLVQQKDRRLLTEIYRSAAMASGFENSIPKSLLSVSPGHIRSVVEFQDSWRLRPLICATLLLAKENEVHPLREIASTYPQFLLDCDEVANLGGAAGHAGNEKFNIADAEKVVRLVYKLVGAIIGMNLKNSTDEIHEGGDVNG